MEIALNGETISIEGTELTLAALLQRQGVVSPNTVSVQLNGEFVDQGRYSSTLLSTGDEVEFLYFMGGGR